MCKNHNIEYNYVCPACIKPFLENTPFLSLEEIRDYQKENASKVILEDKKSEYNLIGIIKIKFLKDMSYSGLIIYDRKDKKIVDTKFTSFKPIFTEYFPSVLFLNQTQIYLNLIKNLKIVPDCYILNSSGQIHPFFYGSACDFGLKIDVPVIGYTKKLLCGELRENSKNTKISGIYHLDHLIGYAIPKPNSNKFLFLSVGNTISLRTATKLFLSIDQKLLSILSVNLNNFIQSCI